MAKDGPLKSRGRQRGRPGAHQRSRLAPVFDGCPWTWPRHCVGTRGRGLERWEAEREKTAAGRGPMRELGRSPGVSACRSWVSHGFLSPTFFWPSLIGVWSAAQSHSLSASSVPPGRHFRSVFCKACNFTSTFLESAIATARSCQGFSLPDSVV